MEGGPKHGEAGGNRGDGGFPGRIVALGGGSGPSLVARAWRDKLDGVTAVVCVSDTGSSTGTCRRLFGVPGPGDLRATLSTFAGLSGSEHWARIWEWRFRCPDSEDLDGMAVGNLVLSALAQQTGGMETAAEEAARLLGIRGRVLPVTADSAQLEAELADGEIVRGELEIRRPGKPPIGRLGWAAGSRPRPARGVLDAIAGADLVVLGPGCLYTSLLPCLMVEGIGRAIRESSALRLYCCNTTTTPGQTDGYTVTRHVRSVLSALEGGGVDAVLVNNERAGDRIRDAYEEIGVRQVLPTDGDLSALEAEGIRALCMPLLEAPATRPRRLHKVDTLRHDPRKLRAAVEMLAGREPRGPDGC